MESELPWVSDHPGDTARRGGLCQTFFLFSEQFMSRWIGPDVPSFPITARSGIRITPGESGLPKPF